VTGTATSEPTETATETPTSTETGTPSATATATEEPGCPLFEGWNLVCDGDGEWPGPPLTTGDEIEAFMNANIDPNVWLAVAIFRADQGPEGMWEVYYKDAPLDSFNTLDNIQPGDAVWIYVTTDATLTIP
jgi:hypothetical protein